MRILIIHDNLTMSALLTRLVSYLWPNALVITTTDGRSGLDQWHNAGAHLVILDWELPRLSGLEVLKIIKRTGGDVPCVMLSKHLDRDSVMIAAAHHVDAFIAKPFLLQETIARLSALLPTTHAELSPVSNCHTFNSFIAYSIAQATLGLPIASDLIKAIEQIRTLDTDSKTQLLRRSQHSPALMLRLLSFANRPPYHLDTQPIEDFIEAFQHVGVDDFINIALELSLIPGSVLKHHLLQQKQAYFEQDHLRLTDIVTKMNQDVEFDLKAARSTCQLYRVGELTLLQLMQAWLDHGHLLDEVACDQLLQRNAAHLGNQIKTQWNLHGTIRNRIGAAYLLPSGTVRREQVIMRIAGLLCSGDKKNELPRLLSRVGLSETAAQRYQISE
ncbi:response regulator [Rhodoferax sp. 4810]|uniref:Response regulator n=1 Tax=Thiospirillum jenense TaxID=1653858 RepID=A0A839H4X0_9GAMM|nr:response regulator [Thiospirillum jenense]MBB1076560.1 response regulator [Rhodoferax jenense]MBB1124734.1 response regulator [Thiospirillum jenense]